MRSSKSVLDPQVLNTYYPFQEGAVIPTAATAKNDDEIVFLTPEQAQTIINNLVSSNTTNSTATNKHRKKRKIESYNAYQNKWTMPIKYKIDEYYS